MRKKFIIFFTIILGLAIFKSDVCLAKLANPTSTDVLSIGEGSAILKWNWQEGSGTLKQFKILYKDKSLSVWTAKYPGYGVGTITYPLMGLEEITTYQWRVKAEAANPANDSDFVDGPEFTTIQVEVPPIPENGGDGGPLELRNPLKADTLWEAIDLVINFFIIAAFAIAPILIIYSAFLMILSHGDAEKVNKGKSIILWTLVALAIILFAKGLPSIVKGMFSG